MEISNENRRCCLITKFRESFRRHLLFILTLSAVIVGFTLGFTIRLAEPTSDTIAWLGKYQRQISIISTIKKSIIYNLIYKIAIMN